jgi:hypothetical protein
LSGLRCFNFKLVGVVLSVIFHRQYQSKSCSRQHRVKNRFLHATKFILFFSPPGVWQPFVVLNAPNPHKNFGSVQHLDYKQATKKALLIRSPISHLRSVNGTDVGRALPATIFFLFDTFLYDKWAIHESVARAFMLRLRSV